MGIPAPFFKDTDVEIESEHIHIAELPEETPETIGDGPREFRASVRWHMTETYCVRAVSLKEAERIALDHVHSDRPLPNPDAAQFVDGTVNYDIMVECVPAAASEGA